MYTQAIEIHIYVHIMPPGKALRKHKTYRKLKLTSQLVCRGLNMTPRDIELDLSTMQII